MRKQTKTRQNEKPKETIKQIMKENFLELKIGTKMQIEMACKGPRNTY